MGRGRATFFTAYPPQVGRYLPVALTAHDFSMLWTRLAAPHRSCLRFDLLTLCCCCSLCSAGRILNPEAGLGSGSHAG